MKKFFNIVWNSPFTDKDNKYFTYAKWSARFLFISTMLLLSILLPFMKDSAWIFLPVVILLITVVNFWIIECLYNQKIKKS